MGGLSVAIAGAHKLLKLNLLCVRRLLAHYGHDLSTHDLNGRNGAFVLITGKDGANWHKTADAVAQKLGIELVTVAIGAGQIYADVAGRWAEVKEISEQGAILVRPDNHIAWRCLGAARDASYELEMALRAILAR